MATFREILSDIKKRKFAPVYIMMGEEPYYIDRLMSALESSVVAEEDREFDQSVFYGADNNLGGVLESASRFPMMSDRQLVLFKESQALLRAKTQLDKLRAYVESPNPNTVLAISFKGDKLNATSDIMKAAKKNKEVVVFESQKVKDYQLADIVRDYCTSEKISMEEKAVHILTDRVGTSLTNLFSEIEKLRVALKGDGQRITADMVLDQIGVSREFNNFELVKALARRDFFQVVNIVRYFEVNPKDNPTAKSTGIIFKFFQQLLVASFSPDKSDKALMEALHLKNSYPLRDLRTGLANYNAAQAVRAVSAIRRFDVMSKGIGSFQKEYALLLELVLTLSTL